MKSLAWFAVVAAAATLALLRPAPAAAEILYAAPELEQMAAPIALYPDALLGQILMASQYPDQVQQADRWRQGPEVAGLAGDELAAAGEAQGWDPSVAALVAFPWVLHMLASQPDWLARLASAYAAQGPDLLDAVQALRRRAQAAGNLESSGEQMVNHDGPHIAIIPARSQTMFIPHFDPLIAYGPWLWSAYPPFHFGPVIRSGPIIRIVVIRHHRYWRAAHCDWRSRRVGWLDSPAAPPRPWSGQRWQPAGRGLDHGAPGRSPGQGTPGRVLPSPEGPWISTPPTRPYTIIAPADGRKGPARSSTKPPPDQGPFRRRRRATLRGAAASPGFPG